MHPKTPWLLLLKPFIALRILTLVAALLGFHYLAFQPSYPYWDAVLEPYGHPLLWSWAGFDGVHYLMLAKEGYNFGLTQAFFPGYFLLLRVLSWVFWHPLWVGLAISHLCFVAGLGVFYRLLRLDYSHEVAYRTLLYLIFFPTSFYFLSLYTESLFLLLLLVMFYCIRLKYWKTAALVGVALTATRFVGIFMVGILLYELWLEANLQKIQTKNWKRMLSHYAIGLVPSLGLILYMGYLWWRFDDPLMFAHVQSGFGAGRETEKLILLYQVFWRYLKMIVTVDWSSTLYFTVWLELLSTIAALGLVAWGYVKKVRLSYLLFALLSLILPTLTGTLSSMPRYVLVAFPLYISLGLVQSKLIQGLILGLSTILLIITTALFTRGYWIA